MKKIWLIRFFTVTRTIISRIGFILRCEIVKTKRAGTLRCKSRHFHGPGEGGGGGGVGKATRPGTEKRNFPCDVFVGVSDRIQCHSVLFGREDDGD